MKWTSFLSLALAFCVSSVVSASVMLPHDLAKKTEAISSYHFGTRSNSLKNKKSLLLNRRNARRDLSGTAMAIPGDGIAEQVFVGGFANFLQIYNVALTARILLSWIPQAQGVGALQPLFAITDPFLNLFRGVIPTIGGLDISPIGAFILLNVLTNSTMAVGAEIPDHLKKDKQFLQRKKHVMKMVMASQKKQRGVSFSSQF